MPRFLLVCLVLADALAVPTTATEEVEARFMLKGHSHSEPDPPALGPEVGTAQTPSTQWVNGGDSAVELTSSDQPAPSEAANRAIRFGAELRITITPTLSPFLILPTLPLYLSECKPLSPLVFLLPPRPDGSGVRPSTDEVGIEGWNETNDSYGFTYVKDSKGSKKSVLVKCLVTGDDLIVDALDIGLGERKPMNHQININDYDGGSGGTNYSRMYKNFTELVRSLNSSILAKLESLSTMPSGSTPSLPRSKESVESECDKGDPRVRVLEPQVPQQLPPVLVYPQVPSLGSSDLYPGPAIGVYPSWSTGIGGGMLLGPNDPSWFSGTYGEQIGVPGGVPGVPPGARFDPYGPPGVSGFEPNRFVRVPRRSGGGAHPDLEHFRDDSDMI
ncbi:PREDICTED: probable proteasome inhibitor [Nelumbo nucifera]|uniref:Probable proteasome inhibitor n=1 Tax=Nelumbo nucifera TaxID=4432 RepID=A0A1U8Q559_NELNU|nr:PREDICTED: probable proteasome inhibitor [Nelumbo nucifera]